MSVHKLGLLTLLASLILTAAAQAAGRAGAPVDAVALAKRWDHINFEIKDSAQALTEADALERRANELAKGNPAEAEFLIWEAAAVLAKADARRDLGSLRLADRARKLLERAAELGVSGDDGAFAYAVLGTLYAEMPRFPLGFGDHKRARNWFAKAYAAAPDNIDVNVLMGAFLLHQRDYAGAVAACKRAIAAPSRPDREIRDRYRRQEASAILADAQKKMAAAG
jgi:tetratricopeptide (TPR) repeat protein